MKESLKKCGALLLVACVFCLRAGVVLADSTPDGTVKEIVKRMKEEGNPSVVVEYVNWEKAYADFPVKQREQLNVKNSAELKAFFQEMLAHPTDMMKKKMEQQLATVAPDKQEEAKTQMVKIEEMMRNKEAEMKERLTSTVYEVGDVKKLDNNKAEVKLTQTYKDQKRTETITLEKDGEAWLLPSVAMVAPQQKPEGAAPAAGQSSAEKPASEKPASEKPAPAKKTEKPKAKK